MPLVAREFRIRSGPAHTGIGGASYGAIAALYTTIHAPWTFGMLMLESPPLFLFGERLIAEAAGLESWPSPVYLGRG